MPAKTFTKPHSRREHRGWVCKVVYVNAAPKLYGPFINKTHAEAWAANYIANFTDKAVYTTYVKRLHKPEGT